MIFRLWINCGYGSAKNKCGYNSNVGDSLSIVLPTDNSGSIAVINNINTPYNCN